MTDVSASGMSPVIIAGGSNQATAAKLTGAMSIVNTPNANGGVMIANIIGSMQTIYNQGAHVLNIYPRSGMSFYGLKQNAPFKISAKQAVGLIAVSADEGYILFGSPSSFV